MEIEGWTLATSTNMDSDGRDTLFFSQNTSSDANETTSE